MTDAPRYRLVGYDIGTAPDENGGWVHWTDHEAIVARLTAERDDALVGAVKVKPLVWGPYPNPVFAGSDIAFANVEWTVPYCYQVQRDPWAPGYMAFGFPRHGTETWNSKGHPTIEAAKAAAQADYDARILAAIQPDPDARQADLAKAWTMGRDAAAGAAKHAGLAFGYERAVQAIRALTPPADLAARIGGAA